MTQDNEQDKDLKWEVPVPFEVFTTPVFPVHFLPTVLSEMAISVADVTQTAVDAASVAIIAMISVAAARKFKIQIADGDGWSEKNNLYAVIALPAGERKSAVFSHLIKPIVNYESELLRGLKGNRRLQRFLTDDVTSEKLVELLCRNGETMALLSTEGGIFDTLSYKNYGKPPNLDVYLKGFSGDKIVIDRKHADPIIMDDPTLTICLFVQPSVLQGLPSRLTGRGLLGRFLYSLPPSTRGRRDIAIKSIPPQISQAYSNVIGNLMDFDQTQPILLRLAPDALEAFQTYRVAFEEKLVEGGELSHDFLRSWTERLPGQLLRIASLFHVAIQAIQPINQGTFDNVISLETINNALSFSNYFTEHAKAAFGCLKSNEELENAKYLLDVLYRNRIATYKRQALWIRIKGKFNSAGPFNRSLAILEDRGFIRCNIIKTELGRNGMMIVCNPRIYTTT